MTLDEAQPDAGRARSRRDYGILSLDGGGSWALIQVRALQELFGHEVRGHDVLRAFKLVVANSGGSIVAGGLAANMKLSTILELFMEEKRREAIFRKKGWKQNPLLRRLPLPIPRYEAKGKREGLAVVLQDVAHRKMVDWKVGHPDLAHIVIVGVDYDRRRATFFRTNGASLAASADGKPSRAGSEATFLDAIHASTNAPILYFDEPAVQVLGNGLNRRYWDGAMAGYNNPVMAGVVEAIANGTSPARIQIVSIGTGSVPELPSEPPKEPGVVNDIRQAALAVLDDPPDIATFVAHVVLGGKVPQAEGDVVEDGPVIRLNPVASVGRGQVSADEFKKLSELELDAVKQDDVKLIRGLCEKWIEGRTPNQPIRPASGDAPADVGNDTFAEAKDRFVKWRSGAATLPSAAE